MLDLGPDRDDDLLRPREAADLMGVRTTTIARWARMGRLQAVVTPGGHRRYRRGEILDLRQVIEPVPADEEIEQDAVRLYEQGWTIRQVADRFEVSYGRMRRILGKHITLRTRGGRQP
jgi:excisionase family DNA binding protein